MTAISVLTPSLNQARWLPDCLASVAVQTQPAFEHLVADALSTDGSREILEQWEGDGRTLLHERDRGQADALNRLFARARGDVIAWVNSDDLLADRRALEWVAEAFEAMPAVDVLYGDAVVVDSEGKFIQYLKMPRFDEGLLRAYNYLVQPAVFVRRRAVDKLARFVDETLDFVFDRDLWFRLLASGAEFQHLDRPLAVDRHRPGRKVLDPGLVRELVAVDRRHEATSHARSVPARRRRVLNRLLGVPDALMLPRRLDPVPGLDLGSPLWRCYAQLARPWRRAVE